MSTSIRKAATLPAPSLGEIGLGQFAPYLMNSIVRRWNTDMAEMLRRFDLTTAGMRTLAVLSVASGRTINELAVLTLTEQSTLSRLLDTLEERDLIARRLREGDMRVREVHLTPGGRATFDAVWPMMHGGLAQMRAGIGPAEYAACMATLRKMLSNVQPDPN